MKTILVAVAALSLSVGAAFAAGGPVGSFHGSYDQGSANSQSAGAGSSTKGG